MTEVAELDPNVAEIVERDGFVIVPRALDDELLSVLAGAVESVTTGPGVYSRNGIYAMRNLFGLAPEVKRALVVPAVRHLAESVLGPDAFCVRGLFFDKTPKTSWRVPWHQDATVTVKERSETTGFGPWSNKAGITHVVAPPGLLSAMLTMRLHLDECGESQGVIKVIPASHQYGRLPEDSIGQFIRGETVTCHVPRGGIFAMRPLLIRTSETSGAPGPRRVIQLDFTARKLPRPLEWHESFPLSA
jgi:ectoine hydroxylase-related dioxygenase (phytanoyl-CoA dioxygenase family)